MKFALQTIAVCLAGLVVLQQAAVVLPQIVPPIAVLALLAVVVRVAWRWTERHY